MKKYTTNYNQAFVDGGDNVLLTHEISGKVWEKEVLYVAAINKEEDGLPSQIRHLVAIEKLDTTGCTLHRFYDISMFGDSVKVYLKAAWENTAREYNFKFVDEDELSKLSDEGQLERMLRELKQEVK